MDTLLPQLITLLGAGRVLQNEIVSKYSSFKTGGNAAVLVEVETLSELQKVVQLCIAGKVEYSVIGSGTLAVFSDKGFSGVIIKNNARRFEVMTMMGKIQNQHINVSTAFLYAESGANMTQVVRYALEQGLGGLEYHLGLPGTIGGALYSNAQYAPKHKYIGEHVKSARILTSNGEIKEVDHTYFAFAFDYSVLQKSDDILLSVVFELSPGDKTQLWEKGREASAHRTNDQPQAYGYTYRNIQVTSSREELIIQPDASEIMKSVPLSDLQVAGVKLFEKRYNYLTTTEESRTKDFCNFITKLTTRVEKETGSVIEIKPYIIGTEKV